MADFLGRKGCICKEYAAVVLRKMLLGGFQGHMSLDEAKKEFSGTEHWARRSADDGVCEPVFLITEESGVLHLKQSI